MMSSISFSTSSGRELSVSSLVLALSRSQDTRNSTVPQNTGHKLKDQKHQISDASHQSHYCKFFIAFHYLRLSQCSVSHWRTGRS